MLVPDIVAVDPQPTRAIRPQRAYGQLSGSVFIFTLAFEDATTLVSAEKREYV